MSKSAATFVIPKVNVLPRRRSIVVTAGSLKSSTFLTISTDFGPSGSPVTTSLKKNGSA